MYIKTRKRHSFNYKWTQTPLVRFLSSLATLKMKEYVSDDYVISGFKAAAQKTVRGNRKEKMVATFVDTSKM